MYLGLGENEDRIKVSKHKCDTCGDEFTVCPAYGEGSAGFENCLSPECASYDPNRDLEIVFLDDKVLSDNRKIIGMEMLRKRKIFREEGTFGGHPQ